MLHITPFLVQLSGSRQRVLCVEVTDESDLAFLHSMSVGEAEFADLKADQAILVDFTAFPALFIELLDRCVEHKGEINPR